MAPLTASAPRGPGAGPGAARRHRRLVACAVTGLLLMAQPLATRAQGVLQASEAAVKAAYIVRFLQFVEWLAPAPAAASTAPPAPIVIGVLAPGDLEQHLRTLAGTRRVDGRELQVRAVTAGDSAAGLDVLFAGQPWARSRLASDVTGRPVLVITDQGLDGPAMLNLLRVGGRIGFEASIPAAERAGLKLSARLLAIAERVVR